MSEIVVYEVEYKIYSLETIPYEMMQSSIASLIDAALCTTDEMRIFHEDTMHFKNYCFSGFMEIESEKIYKQNQVYTIKLRCVGSELANHFKRELPNASTQKLKGLVCTCKTIPKRFITKLYSVTPAIAALEQGSYWRKTISLPEYERILVQNSIKKYNALTGSKIDEDFQLYDTMQFINRTPIAVCYKGKRLLGDKLELMIGSDERSQNISYMLLGTGIHARNARGFGFVNYKFSKL